jgi:hypothetical protein
MAPAGGCEQSARRRGIEKHCWLVIKYQIWFHQTEKWRTEKWQTEKWRTEKWRTEKWRTEKWRTEK